MRWGHGHSIATGGLLVVLAQQHTVWILTVVFVAGIIAGRAWTTILRWSNRSGRKMVDELAALRARRNMAR